MRWTAPTRRHLGAKVVVSMNHGEIGAAQGVALGEGGVRDAEAEIAVAVAEMTRRSAA